MTLCSNSSLSWVSWAAASFISACSTARERTSALVAPFSGRGRVHDEIGNVTERHITEEAAKQFEGLNGIPSQLVEKQFLQTFLADLIDHFPGRHVGSISEHLKYFVPILGITHQTTFDVFLPEAYPCRHRAD